MGKQRNKNKNSKNKNQSANQQEQKRQQRLEKADIRKQRNKAKYQGTSEYKRDFEILLQQIAPLGLTIRDVKADGNCLFRCFSVQLYGTQEDYPQVRHTICDFVESHRDDFEPFVEDDVPWEEYCASMRQDKEWGSNIQLQAASMVFKANITIFQANEPRWDINNFPENAKRFYISYHDHSHYASVVPLNQTDGYSGTTLTSTSNKKPKVNHPTPKDPNDSEPTSEEKLVMQSTGINDLVLIRNTIETFAGDMDSVYNYLFSTLDSPSEYSFPVEEEYPNDAEDYFSSQNEKIIESDHRQEKKNQPAQRKLRKADKKRMKKQQKALERKLEAENKTTPDPTSFTIPDVNDPLNPQLETLAI